MRFSCHLELRNMHLSVRTVLRIGGFDEGGERAYTCVNQLISSELRARLLANGARSARHENHDPLPVVRLFVPDTAAVWLLTELDPDDLDLAFGVCDLGLGAPKLDYVRLSDLAALPGQPVCCDIAFVAKQSLSAYLRDAQALGSIRT